MLYWSHRFWILEPWNQSIGFVKGIDADRMLLSHTPFRPLAETWITRRCASQNWRVEVGMMDISNANKTFNSFNRIQQECELFTSSETDFSKASFDQQKRPRMPWRHPVYPGSHTFGIPMCVASGTFSREARAPGGFQGHGGSGWELWLWCGQHGRTLTEICWFSWIFTFFTWDEEDLSDLSAFFVDLIGFLQWVEFELWEDWQSKHAME